MFEVRENEITLRK